MRNNEKEWEFPASIAPPAELQAAVGGSPLLSQALYQRGIRTVPQARSFLDPVFYQPSLPGELPGLNTAVTRLIQAIEDHETILIWGDFDVDGQTSTTLLSSGLQGLGADVYHYIPNRSTESHGISPESLELRISEYKPAVLLTCDTGIDAVAAVELANSKGIDVIITDHHQLPAALPKAAAIINPNLLSSQHPLHDLPGVGVAYKLIEGLYEHFKQDPSSLLDLAALGIVADVALLRGDNRYLLQIGLPVLRETSRLGLLKLYQLAGINPSDISEETIGFGIGPRLNALGRLDDANTCVEFFTTQDESRAAELASKLETLNLQRQTLTEEIFQDALKMIKAYPELVQDYPIIVLQGSAQWHPGVIGIVASRLVERFQKPVIMLSQDGESARGSARSVPGVPIASLISQSSSLLNSYGGHPMAAGLSLPLENISPFRHELKNNHNAMLGELPEPESIQIDAELPFQSISLDLIQDIKRLAPFGAGNPKLLFATRGVQIAVDSLIGKKRNHRKLLLKDSAGFDFDFLWWNSADIPLPQSPIDIAYSLDITTFREQDQPQATLIHYRSSIDAPVYLPSIKSGPEYLDFRNSAEPDSDLAGLALDSSAVIWAELDFPSNQDSVRRTELKQSEVLVIWTSPPSQRTLLEALEAVSPEQIIFFANSPDIHIASQFIPKLLGLIKAAQENPGKPYAPERFAQAIAVTPSLIETGLDWIHFHGDFDLTNFRETNQLNKGPGINHKKFPETDARLKYLLKEMLSYRTYYHRSLLEKLL